MHIVGGNAAAIGEVGDLRSGRAFLQRHHRDGMAPEIRDACGQARQQLHRNRVDLLAHAMGVGGGCRARISMGVARCPHDNDLFGGTLLGQLGDRLPEVVAKVLFAVCVDDAVETDAQVQDVDAVAPTENRFQQALPYGIATGKGRKRCRVVEPAPRADRECEHRDVGRPCNALRREVEIGWSTQGNARHRGAVRKAVGVEPGNGLVGRPEQKDLVERLSLEHRMVLVDAGVDEADGHSGPRLFVLALQHLQVRIGPIRADGVETPLVLEVLFVAESLGKRCRERFEVRRRAADP